MACLGGTRDEPRVWMHYRADGEVVRQNGRICTGKRLANPHTSRRACAECPAFRGLRWDGKVANGMSPDDRPHGLTVEESARWEAAVFAAELDDDWEPMFAFMARQERELIELGDGRHAVVPGIGERGLRRIGDPGALDRHAEKMREWRAAHPGYDTRKRDRAAYMRDYRARQKAGA